MVWCCLPTTIGTESGIFQSMKTLTLHRKRLAGFSLVEMAIVILIAGIMMGAGLSLLAVKQEATKWDATQKHQEVIKQALINYLGKNRRLPCPAIIITAPTPHVTGAEDRSGTSPAPCAQYSGIVPYQELGLDRAAALDGWESFITYVVSPPVVAPIAPAPPLTTALLYSFSTITNDSSHTPGNNPPTIPNTAFWPSTSTGGITVTDGTTTIANPVSATGAAVVLISYGKNGYGASNVKGGTNTPPPATNTDEQKNVSPFTVPTQPTVVRRDATDSTAGGGPFDDIVMILSTNDLTGPLIANGMLQTSAQTALIQANDIVMGNIVASRLPCPGTAPMPVCTSTSTYYYTIPVTVSMIFTSPPNVVAWGVSYAQVATAIDGQFSTSANAYTLTPGDGSPAKIVSIQELRGILTRGAGFN